MTTFTLTINCDGAAFGESDYDRAVEIRGCLEAVLFAGRARPGDTGPIRDTNGNRVGEWRIADSDPRDAALRAALDYIGTDATDGSPEARATAAVIRRALA